MQTLREKGLGAKAIVKAYPEKQWKLSSAHTIRGRIDKAGSAWISVLTVADDRRVLERQPSTRRRQTSPSD